MLNKSEMTVSELKLILEKLIVLVGNVEICKLRG